MGRISTLCIVPAKRFDLPRVRIHLLDARGRSRDARVIDQDVQTTESRRGVRDHACNRRAIGDVAHRRRYAGQLRLDLLKGYFVDIADEHARARRYERLTGPLLD
jgi:hypothetical protein